MNRVIGYVGTKDLQGMWEEDIRSLDVINIAFGQIREGKISWDGDGCREALARIRSLHPQIKILLSVGGWGADGFSQAASGPAARRLFAESAAETAQRWALDGIDIDWEYPGTSVAGIASAREDRENFTLLLEALRESLDRLGEGRMLTIAAGGDTYFVKQTQMDRLVRCLDYVQLMTYDLQGGFQKVTGHHAALYHGRRNLSDACADKAVRAFLEAGVPAGKLVLGLPFYSRKWMGVANLRDGLGVEAQTVGGYGPDYGELTERFINKNGFVRHWDEEACSPWLFDGSTFISYEDEESLGIKADYARQKGLYGVMYWEYCCDPTRTLTQFLRRRMDSAQ
ncbi:MAG: glycoside hydrolase family 18 protein [Eubacteriales bacterium]|nr:glycoside hydrolase family 18 protein [Eubacteriales bacterium]